MYDFDNVNFRIEINTHKIQMQVCEMLESHTQTVKAVVEGKIEEGVKNFDFEKAIQAHVDKAISDGIKSAIDHFFIYGAGATSIREAASDTLLKMINKLNKEDFISPK